jgi:hypothetical protein
MPVTAPFTRSQAQFRGEVEMRASQSIVGIVLAAILFACSHNSDGDRLNEMPPPSDLRQETCDGVRDCESFDGREPRKMGPLDLRIGGCWHRQRLAPLDGREGGDAASSPLFEWSAMVRWGGVFPIGNAVASPLDCTEHGPGSFPFPSVTLLVAPEGFTDAGLAPGNVFIPMHGEATLDHDFKATADLDPSSDDASVPAVTVLIANGRAYPRVHRGLRAGDAFRWGNRDATVARILPTQSGKFGVIGWVEVRLSRREADGARR